MEEKRISNHSKKCLGVRHYLEIVFPMCGSPYYLFSSELCSHMHNMVILFSLCLYRVKWVDIDGTMYKKPCALIIESENSEGDYPTFAKVLDIYIVNLKVFLNFKNIPL